jgi:hypothetical protein
MALREAQPINAIGAATASSSPARLSPTEKYVTRQGQPIYVSKRTWLSLWQQYRVYHDRIEIQAWVALRTIVIPAEELLEIEVRPALAAGDLLRGKGLGYTFAAKLDLADLSRHVAIRRSRGLFKRLRITPDDPEKFAEMCRSIMSRKDEITSG